MSQGKIISSVVPTQVTAFDDFLSGVDHIESGETFTIPDKKQMVVFDGLTLDGILVIEGKLFLRD